MIPLGDDGLTMLMYTGTTGYNDGGTGDRLIQWQLSQPFNSIICASIESFYGGNVYAYQTYRNAQPNGNGESYVIKDNDTSQTRFISLLIIGYMD